MRLLAYQAEILNPVELFAASLSPGINIERTGPPPPPPSFNFRSFSLLHFRRHVATRPPLVNDATLSSNEIVYAPLPMAASYKGCRRSSKIIG